MFINGITASYGNRIQYGVAAHPCSHLVNRKTSNRQVPVNALSPSGRLIWAIFLSQEPVDLPGFTEISSGICHHKLAKVMRFFLTSHNRHPMVHNILISRQGQPCDWTIEIYRLLFRQRHIIVGAGQRSVNLAYWVLYSVGLNITDWHQLICSDDR